jgi:hypothetical protein
LLQVKAVEDVVYIPAEEALVKKSATMAGQGKALGRAMYFGDNRSLDRGPQAFLVDYGPYFRIDPHFHLVDQFQLFCRGEATIGKHRAVPVTVHYADAFTPYGPIVGGEDGFAFFNFRSRADIGAHLMPGSRDEMVRRAGRGLTATTRLALGDGGATVHAEALIERHADGLFATERVAGPGARLDDEIVDGACRYELVLDGVLELGGRRLARNSALVANGGDRLADRRAGPEGLHLLQVQLPHA